MALVMEHTRKLLKSLRDNDWYITAYPFHFNGCDYVVIFEDLRELKNKKDVEYYAVCLTFIDTKDETRRLETYANAYDFMASDNKLIEYFGIIPRGSKKGMQVWSLYEEFNIATPEEYRKLNKEYEEKVLEHIDNRENKEGFCCYKIKHNGKKKDGSQIFRSGKNTAKTKLLRPSLYNDVGADPTISFCYREKNELSDTEILLTLSRQIPNNSHY